MSGMSPQRLGRLIVAAAFLPSLLLFAAVARAELPSPAAAVQQVCGVEVWVVHTATDTPTVDLCTYAGTLPEARYLVVGRAYKWSHDPEGLGIRVWLEVGGVACGAGLDVRGRTQKDVAMLSCVFDHAGGSVTVTLRTTLNSPGTAVFGVGGQWYAHLVTLAGFDRPAPVPTAAPSPTVGPSASPMTIDAFTGSAAATVETIGYALALGLTVLGALVAALVVITGLRR